MKFIKISIISMCLTLSSPINTAQPYDTSTVDTDIRRDVRRATHKYMSILLKADVSKFVHSMQMHKHVHERVATYLTTSRIIDIMYNSCVNPSIVISQSAIETFWGKCAKHNNYFGIKGRGFESITTEYVHGHRYRLIQSFAAHNSFKHSVMMHSKLLTGHIYNITSEMPYSSVIDSLIKNRYATDPLYRYKLHKIISDYDLQKLDSIKNEYADCLTLLNFNK